MWLADPRPKITQFEEEHLIAELGSGKSLKILDAGCGNGTYSAPVLARLAQTSPRVDAILVDMQQRALDEARRVTGEAQLPPNVSLSFERAKLENLQLETPDGFDLIMFVSLLHFFPSEKAVDYLKKFALLLKPDGVIYGSVCTPFAQSLIGIADEQKLNSVLAQTRENPDRPVAEVHPLYGPMHYYDSTQLQKVCAQAGFELLDFEHFHNNFFPNGLGDKKYQEKLRFVLKL